ADHDRRVRAGGFHPRVGGGGGERAGHHALEALGPDQRAIAAADAERPAWVRPGTERAGPRPVAAGSGGVLMDAAARARELALLGIEVRATQSQNTGTGGGYQPPHVPAGNSKGGQFGTTAGTSSATKGAGSGIGSILPPDSAYKSGGGTSKSKASVPAGTPQPPAEPRTMKVGDSGEDVRYAQYAMNLLGFKVAQDGQYGPETEAAVKQIQERLGVKKPNGHLSAAQLHKLQDAVRLSPCIGAGQRDLAFEAQWEARDIEDVDDVSDEDTE